MNNARIAQAATVIASEMAPEGGYKPNTQYLVSLMFQSTKGPNTDEPVIDFIVAPPVEVSL